jgi:hypothetical protein
MAKPIVITAAGGKPVVSVAAGGLPVTSVSTLGQPVTLVSSLGMPVTLVDTDGTTPYVPSWVGNGGVSWLSYDSAVSGIGTDAATLEIVISLRSLDTNPAAICRLAHVAGGRVDLSLTAAGRMTVILVDGSGSTLVNWTSANNAAGTLDGAGERELRMRADLNVTTPTMEVWTRDIAGHAADPWRVVAGTFATGPVAGTIDSNRAGVGGNEFAFLATVAGANICNCQLAYLWWSSGALLAEGAFGVGVRKDPLTVTPFDLLITGPAATLTADKSAAAKTLVVQGGAFSDVA